MKKSKKTKKSKSVTSASSEKNQGFSLNKKPVNETVEMQEAHKYDLGGEKSVADAAPAESQNPAYEDLGELPQSYGTNLIYLIARDPQWLFTYWDIDWGQFGGEVKDKAVHLKLLAEDGSEVESVEVDPYARNWYLAAPAQGVSFQVKIGFYTASGGWQIAATSSAALVPATTMTEAGEETDTARLPVHVSFQQLLNTVRGAMAAGESLIETLARLQQEGADITPEWSDNRRQLLESLLGREAVAHLSLSSGTIDEVLRRQLQESLSSGSSVGPVSEEFRKIEGQVLSGLSSSLGASWSSQPFGESQER